LEEQLKYEFQQEWIFYESNVWGSLVIV
jgi:hypothetical protein